MAQRDRGVPARAARRPGATGRPVRGEARPADRSERIDVRAVRGRVHELVEPVVTAADLDLDGVSISPAGRRLVVRITVDGDAGVGHDELSDISRDISAALDRAEERGGELTPGSYLLEVSSPGVDRPLTLPRHWRRNVGRLVTVRADGHQITARVTAVDASGVSFEGIGPVAFDALGPGRVQVEFTHLAELSDEDFGDAYADEIDGDETAEIAEEDEE